MNLDLDHKEIFTCICGCVSWNILNGRIKCINSACRREYTIENIDNAEFFNSNNNSLLTSSYNSKDVGRIYHGPKI